MDPVEALPFDALPTEVQMLIFDAMDVRTRLTASEVCHRWNQLAITAAFLRNQVQLAVPLALDDPEDSDADRSLELLQSSDRQYAKLKVFGRHLPLSQHVVPLREILDHAGDLGELELVLTDSWIDEDMSYLVSQVLQSAPALKTLTIDVNDLHAAPVTRFVDDGGQQFPQLTSLTIITRGELGMLGCVPPEGRTLPNLSHLEMSCFTETQLQLFANLQNQLKRFKLLSLSTCHGLRERFLDLELPLLEELALPTVHMNDTSGLCRFFSVRRPLRVLSIDKVLLDGTLAETIFANHPALAVLSIFVDTLSTGALRNITRLTRLRTLHLTGNSTRPCVDYFRGARPHTSVRFMSITSFRLNSRPFIDNVKRTFCNVRKFELLWCQGAANFDREPVPWFVPPPGSILATGNHNNNNNNEEDDGGDTGAGSSWMPRVTQMFGSMLSNPDEGRPANPYDGCRCMAMGHP